jgi:hypothetical protein
VCGKDKKMMIGEKEEEVVEKEAVSSSWLRTFKHD